MDGLFSWEYVRPYHLDHPNGRGVIAQCCARSKGWFAVLGLRFSKESVRRLMTAGALATALIVASTLAPVPASAMVRLALPGSSITTGLTGDRPGATELSFPVSDQVSASVDVGTGNLRVQNLSLSLVGVTGAVTVGQTYNTFGAPIGSTSLPAAKNWTVGIQGVGYLSQGSTGVVYTAGDGSTWLFTPVSGSTTAYTSPAGIKADLVNTGTGYTLTDRQTRQLTTFDVDGQPVSIADRNGNVTSIGYSGAGNPNSVTSSAGPVAARTATLTYSATTFTLTATQTSGASSRNVKWVKDANSFLTSIVDANGKTTSFGYTGGLLSSITSPTGAVITFTYESGTSRVLSVSQANTTAGSPGTSITRITYPSSTQRLVARPNTNQSSSVATVPHLTYTIDATSKLVTAVTDEESRQRGATYTPNGDTATSTSGTGGTAGTTTSTYGANGGDSQTSLQRPGGATNSAAYANTAAATKYLASSTTDSAGNSSTYTYNGAGNALTSTNTALAATATLTYSTDGSGTVATALAPGNGTNKTVYTYTNKQLTGVTPVTGSSLGARAFTYDDFGRVRTATNGRGVTLTYSYDKQDRLTSTSFSDTTPTVTNTYTDIGQPKTRVDGNGTTTYGYDQLGRLISRVNTAGGGTISYGYDKSSNLTSTTDSRGTTTNEFDDSGVPTEMTYNKINATDQVLGFATDNRGRRTDTWLQTNGSRTSWAAHTHNDYDTSSRVSRTIAETGPATTPTTTMDVSYCYNSATPAPTCSTGTTTDRTKLQWSKDNLTGQVTAYTYDAGGRLTKATQTGGTGANTYTYTYDSRGNRLTAVVTGATPSSQTFTANAANQISTAGYTFDGTGNMTADPSGSYTYNGAEQMTKVTQGANVFDYKYAGTSQVEVLQQEKTSATYELTYGRQNQQGLPIVEQLKITAGASTAVAYIENDPVTGQPLMLRTSSGTQALYVYGGTGNPEALLTDFASVSYTYDYDPYGVPVLSSGGGSGATQNPFVFKGGIQDRATGWVHFGARWYNPATGRWTQQDTLDNPLDPKNANRYAYAGCDPINNMDPMGQAVSQCGFNWFLVGIEATGIVSSVSTLATAGAVTGPVGWAVVGVIFGFGAIIYSATAAAQSC